MIAKDNRRTLIFDSYGEFSHYAEECTTHKDRPAQADGDSMRHASEVPDFYGSEDFPDWKRITRKGWDEGAAKMRSQYGKFSFLGSKVLAPHMMYDVCGGALDVASWMQGIPEHFSYLEYSEEEGAGDIIRILCSGTQAWFVDWETVYRRGAAVAVLCDALEKSGRMVAIVLSIDVNDPGATGEGQVSQRILLKRAGDSYSLSNLALALAHRDTLRRSSFAVMEKEYGARWSYGQVVDPAKGNEDVYLPAIKKRMDPNFGTDQACLKWIYETAKKLGCKFENGFSI